ncbi:RluA family pseudouridine synthase [Rossellomorea yichunensis]|uniref:RluA family pseudouridine synthase n=1 Tax=Rossellomorea yichunensis TaxID=3077331 RepID=UPI0028E03D98|nr:RluA family pseudouridine synthase [Rossellomorea sp. YC4-1]MDT9023611.1 RluA family pseudouridine synthase [Rossellomorea sp. YC4-1]
MKFYIMKWVIPSSFDGKLMREFLIDQQVSKRTLTAVKFNGGTITVNGKEENVRYHLVEGDILELKFPEEKGSQSLVAEEIPLSIIYEDGDVLVVDKPWGMKSIPTKYEPTGSLANAIAGYYERVGICSTVHIVTRLDKDTSGLVLVAKHRHVHHLFSLQQKGREIKRTYEAFAEGRLDSETGTIEEPIGRKPDSIIEREVRQDGRYALTHYRVKKQFQDFAHIELRLETGRTHQIRVHMSFIGHPLAGDDLYGGSVALIGRQALHCENLSFFHPVKKEWVHVEAAMPRDMQILLERQ